LRTRTIDARADDIVLTDMLVSGADKFLNDGFVVIENIYSDQEVESLIEVINKADQSNPTFRKTNDLFAIRQFLKEVPEIYLLIFTDNLNNVIHNYFGDGYFVVKSIYFDKPEQSNWFVAYHQDLTISVDRRSN
jgi:hypothetical protein